MLIGLTWQFDKGVLAPAAARMYEPCIRVAFPGPERADEDGNIPGGGALDLLGAVT